MLKNRELMDEYNIFKDNLKIYRKQESLTQEMLAEKSDLSISYIKQIESGSEFKNISLISLVKISKALNINLKDLFEK